MKERRVKVFYICETHLIEIFNLKSLKNVRVPGFDLPPDAIVTGVFGSPARMCLGVVVHHPSFPAVPKGELMPEITGVDLIFRHLKGVKVDYA